MPNKGEWSEPYAAIRIIGDKRLYVADADGKRNPAEWMNILELIRHETGTRTVKYVYNNHDVDVDIYVNGNLKTSVSTNMFPVMANTLSREIQAARGNFDVSDPIKEFLEKIELLHIKAQSVNKSDIFLSIEDPRAGVSRKEIGFSIKSQFGHNPTLFNTAKASAFIYKLSNMTDALMNEINGMFDAGGHAALQARCDALLDNGCVPVFFDLPEAARSRCRPFRENLDLIDPRLVSVIDRLLRRHFFEHETRVDLAPLIDFIIEDNPCNISRPEVKYPYMMKSFLYAAYCGMTASTLWTGISQVNGGFIKVDASGEVLAYYALESDEFKSYLYNNCYLEFPSTDEHHGNYGKVYKDNGEYYFRLNFQIRYR